MTTITVADHDNEQLSAVLLFINGKLLCLNRQQYSVYSFLCKLGLKSTKYSGVFQSFNFPNPGQYTISYYLNGTHCSQSVAVGNPQPSQYIKPKAKKEKTGTTFSREVKHRWRQLSDAHSRIMKTTSRR